VRNISYTHKTLGSAVDKRIMRRGITYIHVFSPHDSGTQQVDVLAAYARRIFEGRSLSNHIWFMAANIHELGVSGEWFLTAVELPFNYTERA
jgi:hypothetical protein